MCFMARRGLFLTKTYKGNKVDFFLEASDTTAFVDSVTKERKIRVTQMGAYAIKLNGKEIAFGSIDPDSRYPDFIRKAVKTFGSKLDSAVTPLLSQLADGHYMIMDIDMIIDERGRVGYIESSGFPAASYDSIPNPVGQKQRDGIDKMILNVIDNAPAFPMLKTDKGDSPYEIGYTLGYEVKNGHVLIWKPLH